MQRIKEYMWSEKVEGINDKWVKRYKKIYFPGLVIFSVILSHDGGK